MIPPENPNKIEKTRVLISLTNKTQILPNPARNMVKHPAKKEEKGERTSSVRCKLTLRYYIFYASLGGFEPPTTGSGGQRSVHWATGSINLNYFTPTFKIKNVLYNKIMFTKKLFQEKILPICVLITLGGSLFLRTIFKGSILTGNLIYRSFKKPKT